MKSLDTTHMGNLRKSLTKKQSYKIENWYIGKDGRTYGTPEGLQAANERWKNKMYPKARIY